MLRANDGNEQIGADTAADSTALCMEREGWKHSFEGEGNKARMKSWWLSQLEKLH